MIIYRTMNIINGKIYVGKSSKECPAYLGSGKALKLAIKKYGRECFCKTIIDRATTNEELDEKEIFWIKELNARNPEVGYNIMSGGQGGDTFTNNPNKDKIKSKISATKSDGRMAGENHPMFGRTGTLSPHFGKKKPEHSARMSGENNPAKRADVRAKISATMSDGRVTGRNNPMFGKKRPDVAAKWEKLRRSNASKESSQV